MGNFKKFSESEKMLLAKVKPFIVKSVAKPSAPSNAVKKSKEDIESVPKPSAAVNKPEAMPRECPQCSSHDIQRAAMGFMAGTSQVSGTGVGVTLGGDVGIGSYGGTQQTLLSDFLRPPAKRWVFLVVICTYCIATFPCAFYFLANTGAGDGALTAIFLAPILVPNWVYCVLTGDRTDFDVDPNSKHFILGFVLLVIAPTIMAIFAAKKNHSWNKTIHPKLMQEYNRKWYCRKCGHTWQNT